MVNIYLDEIKDENICLKDELESRQLQLDEARAARSVDDSRLEEVYEIDRSGSKKRALKEKQLSPVNELKPPGTSDTLTPMDRKRRRLNSATPQVSEVFTPPTDSESVDSPHI